LRTTGATTMERIAKATGASTRALYSRYDNKLRVPGAVIDRDHSRIACPACSGHRSVSSWLRSKSVFDLFEQEVVMRIWTQSLGLKRMVCAEGHRYPDAAKFFTQEKESGMTKMQAALETWHARLPLPYRRSKMADDNRTL